MQVVDMDELTLIGRDGVPQNILRIFGVNDEGVSIVVGITGFHTYLYAEWPARLPTSAVPALRGALEAALKAQPHWDRRLSQGILHTEVVDKVPLRYYQQGRKRHFVRFTMALPKLVSAARKLLESGVKRVMNQPSWEPMKTYESNISPVLRFMVDRGIVGGGWIRLPPNTYTITSMGVSRGVTLCQWEVHVGGGATQLEAPPTEGEWARLAPWRILSFDIECAGRRGFFPSPDQDKVIQIACVLQILGETQPAWRVVFVLDSCNPVRPDVTVIENRTEVDLLTRFGEFLRAVDPDILTGYNSIDFDTWYLLERADHLGIADFGFLGRSRRDKCTIKEKTFSSKAFGSRKSKHIQMHGRIQLDVLPILRREYKLRSYTLNFVSQHFLKNRKEDVHHSAITGLQEGPDATDETRARLARYCVKDAELPLQLIEKLMLIINYMEMARVTGVPFVWLLTRGQQIKVYSKLLRATLDKGFVIPSEQRTGESFEGATVVSPKRGFYTEPIATLDFASLYPSIMIAHNLCYTTLVHPSDLRAIEAKDPDGDSITHTPAGSTFVKASVQPGLLPDILKELLSARKLAKRDMKNAKDPMRKAVFNGRQLALKITANSVYGFCGAQMLPELAISQSVTAFGRQMIEQTKTWVETNCTIANGYPNDAEVVYGDTDSVMIKYNVQTVAEAMALGQKDAELITRDLFISPIKLEFEKVFMPYLLLAKKRYAGMHYESNPDKPDKMNVKGIETVRRDFAPLTGRVLKGVLDRLLYQADIEGAETFVKQEIQSLLLNKTDIAELILSKQLSRMVGDPDYRVKLIHTELAHRMALRDPGSAPVRGDRVPFVILRKGKKARKHECSEDPLYALENQLPIDTSYYIDSQLRKPLERILEPVLGEARTRELFIGEHTRRKVKRIGVVGKASKVGGILRFARIQAKCVACNTPLQEEGKGVCFKCEDKRPELLLEALDAKRTAEHEFGSTWSECQRCQGSVLEPVLCRSTECPIFFRRVKARMELERAEKQLASLEF